MIQVMIVEDEAPIRRSLKLTVESAHDRFEVVAMVNNGQEALNILEHIQVDVLITDIRMPLMNGLELTQKVRECYPDILIILFSGYQEFDYAQQAMQLGVRHYLLKPTSKFKIKQLLDTINVEIIEKKKSSYDYDIRSLISGESHSDMYISHHKRYGHHLLLLCCAGLVPLLSIDDEIPGKVFWEQKDAKQIISDEIDGIGDFTVVNGSTVSERWIMISLYKKQRFTRSARDWVNIVADRLGREMPVTIVDSQFFTDIQETTHLTKVLRTILNKHIRLGVSAHFSIYDDIDLPTSDAAPDQLMEREFSLALDQLNFVFFRKTMKNMFDKWKLTLPSSMSVRQHLTRIVGEVYRALGSPSSYSSDIFHLELHSALLHASDYESLYRSVCIIIDSLILQGEAEKETRGDNENVAKQIEEYICKHFSEPIDHQTLSERFGLVPSYLSKIFSDYKGTSPAKYIVQLRVEAAKGLLLDHLELLTKDIAYVVGYTDPSYFSRIFKRETGLYPSEFRKKYGVR